MTIGILSAFGGKLASPVIELPDGSLHNGYNIPVYQAFSSYSPAPDLSTEIQQQIATFKYEGKLQKTSLFEIQKQPNGGALIDKYSYELNGLNIYSYNPLSSYGAPGSGDCIHVPILEMQGPMVSAKPLPTEAVQLLKELYVSIVAEAEFDALSEESEKFAKPLATKIRKLNKLLKFETEEPKPAVSDWPDGDKKSLESFIGLPSASGCTYDGYKNYLGDTLKHMASALKLPAVDYNASFWEATSKHNSEVFSKLAKDIAFANQINKGYIVILPDVNVPKGKVYMTDTINQKHVHIHPADKEILDSYMAAQALHDKAQAFIKPAGSKEPFQKLGEISNLKFGMSPLEVSSKAFNEWVDKFFDYTGPSKKKIENAG